MASRHRARRSATEKPRNQVRLSQAPMAVASDGTLLVNVAYAGDCNSVEEVVKLISDGSIAGRVFFGVVLVPSRTKAAMKHLDDAVAEIAATSGALVQRPRRRGQR